MNNLAKKRNALLLIIVAVIIAFGAFKFGTTQAPATSTMDDSVSESTDIINEVPEEILPNVDTTVEPYEHETATESTRTVTITRTVDTTALPMGDGKISTSPKKGYVYSCQTEFSAQKAVANHTGDWVYGDTWNLQEKLTVEGSVSWPNAWFKTALSGLSRLLTGNGLPVGSNTGIFPIAKTDPAYQIDPNPNPISAQTISYTLPANPTLAAEPSCVPMGAIGVMLNGTALYNALDAGGRDAVAHEVQDVCNGHPERTGEYHYHGSSDCVDGSEQPNKLIGYALDGFGIYSRFDANGNELSTDDLDECHGTTSEIEWNGEMVDMYHYVITEDYPYTVGCFRGTPVISLNTTAGLNNSQRQSNGGGTPPQGAIDACGSKKAGASCSFTTPQGSVSGSCKQPPNQTSLACVP